jgi:hypothetical protein
MDYVWEVYHVDEDTSVEVYMGRISRNPWDLGILFLLFAIAPFLLAAIGILPKTWLYWFITVPCIICACMLFWAGLLSRSRRQ